MKALTEAQRVALRQEIDRRTRKLLPTRLRLEKSLERDATPDKIKRRVRKKRHCSFCKLLYDDCEQTSCILGQRRTYMREYLRGVRRRG